MILIDFDLEHTIETIPETTEEIILDEDSIVIGLNHPIEETPSTQAYPPIHKHDESNEVNHKSDSDNLNQEKPASNIEKVKSEGKAIIN